MDELNNKFGIKDRVEFSVGNGGLTKAELKIENGTKAEIYLLGSHVVSFKNSSNEELLYMSGKAVFESNKAIRGGIPVCFPQFANFGELPQHGFARTKLWNVVETKSPSDKEVSISLQINDDEETRKYWPHKFTLTLTTTITYDDQHYSQLHQTLHVVNNNDKESFSFTTALHTYIYVSDTRTSKVLNMKGLTYEDRTKTEQKVQKDDITFDGETDRIYYNAPNEIVVVDKEREVVVKKETFPDAVVWNVGFSEKAKAIQDLGPWETIMNYVCIEASAINIPVILKASGSWTAKQHIYERKHNINKL